MGTHQPIRKTVAPEIPDKLYFRIGDVARICEVPAYVLRFWETEFPQLKPNKGGTGQRLYRKRDVEMALRIKSLLYDQGYTIPGARQVFKSEGKPKEETTSLSAESVSAGHAERTVSTLASPPQTDPGAALRREAQLRRLREEMSDLLASLGGPVAAVRSSETRHSEVKPTEVRPIESRNMRPRLVLEPRPAVQRTEPPRLQLAQRDLFALDAADSAE